MIINRNKLFSGILLFALITGLLVFFDIKYLYLRAIFSFLFLTFVPGFLVMLMLKVRRVGGWEYIAYTLGLSLSYLIFVGLAINWIFPWLQITDKPLALTPLLFSFYVTLSLVGLIGYIRNKNIPFTVKFPKLDRVSNILFIIPTTFPILSILGANTLNNGGSNYLTMLTLGGIAAFVLFVVLIRDKLKENIYPWSILMISLSLLLMFSMRSWHIIGWDINQEYEMFKTAAQNFRWSMSDFPRQPYNACLSITILPTILNAFMDINDEYIFKLFSQIIFSFSGLAVFLFLKKYAYNVIIYLASFFFIAQPQYIMEMPTLVRQEFALLFFILSLLVLFNNAINSKLKNTLFIIFGFSTVVSHYSTAYITTTLFTLIYLGSLMYRKTENKKIISTFYRKLRLKGRNKFDKAKYHLNGFLVIALIVFSFLWLNQVTKVSDSLVELSQKTLVNMGRMFSDDMRVEHTSLLNQFNILYKPKDQGELLKSYFNKINLDSRDRNSSLYYPASQYSSYKPKVINSKILPSNIDPDFTPKIFIFLRIIEVSIKLLLLVGIYYMVVTKYKNQKMNIEMVLMIILSAFIVGAVTVLPVVSLHYPIERLYQQALIALSLPTVLGSLFIFRRLVNEKVAIRISAVILIIHFLYVSGFIPQLVGGSESHVTLNNFGRIYDQVHTNDATVMSITWLAKENKQQALVQADIHGHWRLQAYALTKDPLAEVIPQVIKKDAYVYSNYINTTKKQGFIAELGVDIAYNFPTLFLSENKNKIYSNGSTEVFK